MFRGGPYYQPIEPAPTTPSDYLVEAPGGGLQVDPALIEQNNELRLIVAMTRAVATKGYSATWVDDIVAEAKASKSTFYKCFESRADCMLRGYDLVMLVLMRSINQVLPADGDQVSRFNIGLTELLRLMAAMPEFTRCFLLEFPSVGAVANDRKHAVVESIGKAIVRWDREIAEQHPEYPEISEVHAIGLTAAIYELLYWKARRDGVERIAEIGPEISSLHNLIYAQIRERPPG